MVKEVEELYRGAVRCNHCFKSNHALQRARIRLPQPRWVGPAYGNTQPRVLAVLLNPGDGGEQRIGQESRFERLLRSFKSGDESLEAVISYERDDMELWGSPSGSFLPFYTSGLGLSLDSLAILNLALCSTKGNKRPSAMLSGCFEKHTRNLARALRPDVILLSGTETWRFGLGFLAVLPDARLVPMHHYAHRKSNEIEARDQEIIRSVLATIGQPSGRTR